MLDSAGHAEQECAKHAVHRDQRVELVVLDELSESLVQFFLRERKKGRKKERGREKARNKERPSDGKSARE